MNTEELIIQMIPSIAQIVRIVIVILVAKVLIPWIKEWRIYSFVKKAVRSAEKLAAAGSLDKAEKKNYVIALLENKGIVVNRIVLAFIEAAVEELDIAKGQLLNYFAPSYCGPEFGETYGETEAKEE